ncbi:MAG: HAMP domain-containing protein [Spirochaetales bacterium]|nr:HAMP domain-containing protein [Spirochaetales bacterium]
MLIGKKMNVLIIGVILSMFMGIVVFVLIYIPVLSMRTEKDSLLRLDSSVSELRADINKLASTSFSSQVDEIKLQHQTMKDAFGQLDKVEVLRRDPAISDVLDIIARLYSLYDANYGKLEHDIELMSIDLKEIFLSTQVKLDEIISSKMLESSEKQSIVQNNVRDLKSTIAILDSNLISTHMVVLEKFEVVDSIIAAREARAYVTGLIAIVLLGIAAFIAAYAVAHRIVRNVRAAGAGIETLSAGDISSEIMIKSDDEIGQLGQNLNILIMSLRKVFESMKNSSTEGVELKEELMASANQTSAAATQIASTSRAIEDQFTALTSRVSGAAETNNQMKSSLQSLDEWVQDQMAMVEESTSSVTEMISSINNVADITMKKRKATETLVKTAELGGSKLSATTAVINDITNNLDEIKGTASIIQQIASQTNLLAMNAAIEAAHAGDAGRGFAVVADEIRKLAEASSMNSKQISGVLKEVVNRIEIASQSSKETEDAFRAIDLEVKDVSQSLDEISSSMDELSVGGRQILEAMTNLQDVSVKVSRGSELMNEASGKVTEAIDVVSRITAEVSGSASEISIGITEVSGAMILVTELSGKLGAITDNLEKEAMKFKTAEAEITAQAVPDLSNHEVIIDSEEGSTAVTLADEEAPGIEYEELS